MPATEATVPTDFVPNLELLDGDIISGEVHDGKLTLSVIRPSSEKNSMGKGFGSRWLGKFKEISREDFTDDPRAEYILSR